MRSSKTSDTLGVPNTNRRDSVGVGKDNDGLIASMSLETCLSLPENCKKIYNSKTESGAEEMLEAAVELMVHMAEHFPERLKNLDCPEIAQLDLNNKKMDSSEVRDIMQSCVQNHFNLNNFGAGTAYDIYLAFKVNTPRITQEPLSPQWRMASTKYNLPKEFAMGYRDTVLEEKNILSFRLDEKSKALVSRPSGCKPSYIWFKVGNWGPMNGRIPEDQTHLGKTNDKGEVVPGAHTKVTEHPENYPELITKKPMTYTLQEMLQGVADGIYTHDKHLTNENQICFRPIPGVGNNPIQTDVVFAITMNEKTSNQLDTTTFNKIANNTECKATLEDNSVLEWNDKWGPKEKALEKEYTLAIDHTGTGDQFKTMNEIVIPLAQNPNKQSVFNYVQHSYENYNPYIQSNLNTPAIHVGPDGNPAIKIDYKGHTNILESKGENQVMHINPNWDLNMNLGGKLVLEQIKLSVAHGDNKVPLAATTFNAFAKTLESNPAPLDPKDFASIVKMANRLGDAAVDAKTSLCNYATNQMKTAEKQPFHRETLGELISPIKTAKVDDKSAAFDIAVNTLKDAAIQKRQEPAKSAAVTPEKEVEAHENVSYRGPK